MQFYALRSVRFQICQFLFIFVFRFCFNVCLLQSHGSLFARSSNDVIAITCRYEFRLRVTLGPGGDLMLTSRIRNTNTDGKSFTFTFAYHTYLFVTDIRFSDAISCYCFEFFIIKFMFPGQLYLTGKHHKHMLLLRPCCYLTSISSAIYLFKTPGYNSFQNRVVKMEW